LQATVAKATSVTEFRLQYEQGGPEPTTFVQARALDQKNFDLIHKKAKYAENGYTNATQGNTNTIFKQKELNTEHKIIAGQPFGQVPHSKHIRMYKFADLETGKFKCYAPMLGDIVPSHEHVMIQLDATNVVQKFLTILKEFNYDELKAVGHIRAEYSREKNMHMDSGNQSHGYPYW